MAKQTISITRALVELKRYEQRIAQALNNGTFSAVSFGEGGKTRVESINRMKVPGTVKEVEELIAASFQSVNRLILNRQALKAAIVKSNATTVMNFMGREITVAEAIEVKSSVNQLRMAHATISNQVTMAMSTVSTAEAKLAATIENLTAQALGGSGKVDAVAQEAISKVQYATHRPAVIGHEYAQNNLESLQNTISAINAELDFSLSEVNAKTLIEVEL